MSKRHEKRTQIHKEKYKKTQADLKRSSRLTDFSTDNKENKCSKVIICQAMFMTGCKNIRCEVVGGQNIHMDSKSHSKKLI